ncbi:MAG: STN and carboxypeptidase regulatory-like domain-containing protein [Bacteroidia bacterium]
MKTKLLILGIFCISFKLIGQNNTPILDRIVTVKVVNESISKTLNIISEAADFNFSYNNSVLNTNSKVSIHAEKRSVQEVLDQLFQGQVTYQQIGKHLVLQKKPIAKPSKRIQSGTNKPVRYNYVLSGYLRDLNEGEGLKNVSIYEKSTLTSTMSGDFGYFKTTISSKSDEIELKFSKQGFQDTSLKIKYDNNGLITLNLNLIELNPILDPDIDVDTSNVSEFNSLDTITPVLAWHDSSKLKVEETKVGKWLIGTYQKINENNIRDSFNRKWQLTLIPPIGTNRDLSGFVTNDLSVNLFAGYNGGVNGAEFGGLVNIVKNDMIGAQFSGFGNIVGRRTEGAQFAGFFNHNLGEVNAFQAAGFYNYNNQDSRGVQLAGFVNVNRGKLEGVQGAGFVNLAKEVDGGQIAGFINMAKKVRGFQIGIINIADTNTGIAIGILNFIKNGMHQIELSSNESEQYGLAYRSGTGKFYSNVMISSQLPTQDRRSIVTYGFGVGTTLRLSNTFRITSDISSQQMTIDFLSDYLNLQNRLTAALEIKLIKGLAIFGGVSLNHMLNDTLDPNYDTKFKDFGRQNVWSYSSRVSQKAWTGFQFGLRIL